MSKIPRPLYVAMTVQFAVGGAIVPFISVFLRERGLDYKQISHIFMASSATLLVFPLLWGMLADRFIPLNRLFTFLNIAIIGWLGLVLTAGSSFLYLLIGFTLFYGFYNPTLTLINALSFHHLHSPQKQFGKLRAWGSIGWILPSVPIWLWLLHSPEYKLDFTLFVAAAACLTMIGVSFILPHTPAGGKAHGLSGKPAYLPAVKKLLADSNFLTILLSFFMMAGSFFLLIFYSQAFLIDLGVKRAWIGPIFSFGVIGEVFLFFWLPKIISRWNYTTVLLIGCFALLCRQILFSVCTNPWILAASYLLSGLVVVFYYNGISILVNAIAGPRIRATAQTLLVFTGAGIGPMFANWMAGYLAGTKAGLRPVFIFASVLAALATLIVLFRGRSLNHIPHPDADRELSPSQSEIVG